MSNDENPASQEDILPWDAEVMLKPCTGVSLMSDEDFDAVENLVERMMMLCKARSGLGLSANQVGKSLRVFIMRTSLVGEFEACINPVIVRHGRDTVISREGCLSAPGNPQTKVRWRVIDVSYLSGSGLVTKTLKGLAAIVFQHEYSHLMGEAFVQNSSKDSAVPVPNAV